MTGKPYGHSSLDGLGNQIAHEALNRAARRMISDEEHETVKPPPPHSETIQKHL
jgi:hypothetical protein